MANEWPDDIPIGTAHPVPRVEIPHAGLSYACQDCDAVFRVDPADPFEAHGRYLDHLDVHEADEAEQMPVLEDQDDVFEDPTDSCSCTWIDDPQCEYHHGPEAGY